MASVAVFMWFSFLLAGGEALVREGAAIARGHGVPPVAVGLTVAAFGTSAPEFVVAITGAVTGAEGVVFGNVVGANIINIAPILGVTALIHPISVYPTIITRELPMLLLAMTTALVLSLDEYLDGSVNQLSPGDGLMLCLLYCLFLHYTVMVLRGIKHDAFIEEALEIAWKMRFRAMSIPVFLLLMGLVGLGVGGHILVQSAVAIAERLGMTQALIGLTIVAIGTTFPELATSVLAAKKRGSRSRGWQYCRIKYLQYITGSGSSHFNIPS